MALFKVNRGKSENLPQERHNGWAYFCTDTAEFFIDYEDDSGIIQRKQLNAAEASRLIGYDIVNEINESSEVEIPTAKAILGHLGKYVSLPDRGAIIQLSEALLAALPELADGQQHTIEFTPDEEDTSEILEFQIQSAVQQHNTAVETHTDIRQEIISAKETLTTYVNDSIAAIPTPDVSGQINGHNVDVNAHEDIRQAIETAKMDVKNDLLNGAGEAYDTLKELGDLINKNQDAITTLETIASTQADWDVNDPEDPAYIKNRTHYKGFIEFLPLTAVEYFDDAVGAYLLKENFNEEIDLNTKYTVEIDGVVYENVAPMYMYGETGIIINNIHVIAKMNNNLYYANQQGDSISTIRITCNSIKKLSWDYIEGVNSPKTITLTWDGKVDSLPFVEPLGYKIFDDYLSVLDLPGSIMSYKRAGEDGTITIIEPYGGYNSDYPNAYVVNPYNNPYVAFIVIDQSGIYFNGYSQEGDYYTTYPSSFTFTLSGKFREEMIPLNIKNGTNKYAINQIGCLDGSIDRDNTIDPPTGEYSASFGYRTRASGRTSFAINSDCQAQGSSSFASGDSTKAIGHMSHAEGRFSKAIGDSSHAEGYSTEAYGEHSHAEGYSTEAYGEHSHAEGYVTQAYGENSHAEGTGNYAYGYKLTLEEWRLEDWATDSTYRIVAIDSKAPYFDDILQIGSIIKYNETYYIITSINSDKNIINLDKVLPASAINETTGYIEDLRIYSFGVASGKYSHTENSSLASGEYSHAEGSSTVANGESQHVQGKFNIPDAISAHIVGNGNGGDARSNAHTIDWNGNAWFAGDVYIGSTSGTNKDEGSKKLATEEYVNTVKNDLLNGAGEAYDTLKELGDLIDDNHDAIDALEIVAASKVAQTDFNSHVNNKNNPHGVTAAQVGAPTVAEMNAAISAIPTPDVSGQINTHNTSTTAHNDIRTLITNIVNGTTTIGKATSATNIYSSASTAKAYVLGTTTASSANHATVYNASVYTSGSVLYGAAWNDYAEYRISDCYEAGRVICENGDDTLSIATKRLQPGANVISDTFGFAIGETQEAKTPIAVSGRVLVYTYEDRNEFKAGDAVCAAPNGTVSKMTREEIREYPERIVGVVSAIPNYNTWGAGNVPVNNRIWIKVK